MADDVLYMSAVELLDSYRRRHLTPLDVAKAVLARIDEVNPRINAVCFRDDATTLRMARDSEERWMRGEPMGLLDGIPVAIKDFFFTRGWPTLLGSKAIDPSGPWTEDDPCVARLREHGAVFVGKTTLPEFAASGVTNSPLTGVTVTPWDTTRTSGGSSGGSAAAVSAGIGPIAPGNDAAGSIRTPASFCGIVGFKPSFGRVPIYPGHDFGETTCTGPLTRTVADAALMMNVMTLPDPRDWLALPYDGRDYRKGLDDGVRGLRIALSIDLGYSPYVDPEIAAIVKQAAGVFAELGGTVEEASPELGDPLPSFDVIFPVVAANLVRSVVPPQRLHLVGDSIRCTLATAERISALEYTRAMDVRRSVALALGRFHQAYDLLLTPTDVVPPFAAGLEFPPQWDIKRTEMWETTTYVFNYSRQPAITVPCGFTQTGLPVGLQIVGRIHEEALVLRAARAFEAATAFHRRRPPVSPGVSL